MTFDESLQLSIHAGTPLPAVVRIEMEEKTFKRLLEWSGNCNLFAVNHSAGLSFACQLSPYAMSAGPQGAIAECALYILVQDVSLPLETHLFFDLKAASTAAPADRKHNPWSELPGVYLDHQEDNARVVVSIEGKLFTRYLYAVTSAKPYFYPIIGPHGKTLIHDGPDDHLHHHGLWWGHDDVNSHKLYHEFRGEGRQVHRTFVVLASGPVFGQMTALIDWLDENGRLLLTEARSVRIYNLPPESRYMDLTTQLYAVNGDVRFGDTKEGGFPFIRVNEQISGHHRGGLTSAEGKKGEADIFGSVTEWVDYSGELFLSMQRDGDEVVKQYTEAGIAVFSHPENETFASQWFVRDYGPFTPANFHFCGGKLLPGGDAITMKHRIYIHEGNTEKGGVKDRYSEYAEHDWQLASWSKA
ncbi:hypothetical protein BK120_12470 [Paenibacillus sp. FSL A5-0031]|uniref:DUF6807 domain-containing protein n=1 Tax=Paenibacillus sp. FSL A5-0031 TaxID=1920420 RepID=UPI00096EC980|nr:PmoA family protein [Paenibacillus sp. FSL A5-0031]OME83929.1 hypothetical protein BK120_12470 [Paenibacillus sp. FSL A5-0031]